MHKSKPSRGRPWRKSRAGAAEFARAMAKAEFGRHYVNDQQLEEVQRSMTRAKARRAPAPENSAPRSTTQSGTTGSKKTR